MDRGGGSLWGKGEERRRQCLRMGIGTGIVAILRVDDDLQGSNPREWRWSRATSLHDSAGGCRVEMTD